MNEQKQYYVTVRLYTWADSPQDALDSVVADLIWLCELDNPLAGFIQPSMTDVVEDTEA